MSNVEWWKIKDQSLALAAREAGYDLTMFHEYPEETQENLKSAAIRITLKNIDETFLGMTERKLSDIRQGVYVICLSQPFTIEYEGGCSEIIYIGMGNIRNRLKSHFENSLFDFMMSIAGANFDFYLTEPVKSQGDMYYKHIEYMLLNDFHSKRGEFPLLNTNAGSKKDFDDVGAGWNKPLKASGKKPVWQIKPTKHWQFAKLD